MTKKYVCDTNVLLSSLISKNSPPAQVVSYIIENGLFVFSSQTFFELEDVLQRPKFDKFIPLEQRLLFLKEIHELCVFSDPYKKIEICRDSKDNKFLEVALSSAANFLITGDDDLLILEKIENIPIITPKKFIEEIQ